MALSNAKVEVNLGDLQELQNAKQLAETALAAALAEVDKLRLDGASDTANTDNRALSDALNNALTVVQFGIAHLDPMTVRGWPHAALAAMAAGLDGLPGLPASLTEISASLRLFAERAKYWEDAREKGIEQDLLAEENAARSASVPSA